MSTIIFVFFTLYIYINDFFRYNNDKGGGDMPREPLSNFDKATRNKISTNLKRLTESMGLTQAELSAKVNIPASTLSGYFAERSTISAGNLQKLSDFFGVKKGDIDERYREDDIDLSKINNIILPHAVRVPLIGQIAAGTPILAEENIEDFLYMDRSLKIDFCLKVKGDSMIDANIFDGDIALFKKQPDLENGEIGAVVIGEEATLKKVYKTENSLILNACNENYAPIVVKEDEPSYIAGKLIGVIHKY